MALYVGFKKEDVEILLGYLESKPYAEVYKLIEIIRNNHKALNVNEEEEESIGLTD